MADDLSRIGVCGGDRAANHVFAVVAFKRNGFHRTRSMTPLKCSPSPMFSLDRYDIEAEFFTNILADTFGDRRRCGPFY